MTLLHGRIDKFVINEGIVVVHSLRINALIMSADALCRNPFAKVGFKTVYTGIKEFL